MYCFTNMTAMNLNYFCQCVSGPTWQRGSVDQTCWISRFVILQWMESKFTMLGNLKRKSGAVQKCDIQTSVCVKHLFCEGENNYFVLFGRPTCTGKDLAVAIGRGFFSYQKCLLQTEDDGLKGSSGK